MSLSHSVEDHLAQAPSGVFEAVAPQVAHGAENTAAAQNKEFVDLFAALRFVL